MPAWVSATERRSRSNNCTLEVAFERFDLLGQRRTGGAEPFGGAAEVQLFGDGDEVPQLTQLHRKSVVGEASQQ